MPDVALRQQELLHRLAWLVRVRWVFLASLGFAILAGRFVFHVAFPVVGTVAVGGAVLAYNVIFHRVRRARRSPAPDLGTIQAEAGLQIGLDLVALTTLIHLTGGIENPFLAFYLFHAIVGSFLLSNRAAWLVGIAGFGLFLAVVILEYASVLPHHPPTGLARFPRHQDVQYVIVVSAALLAALCSTIAITSAIVNGIRLRERELTSAQQALLARSRDLQQAYANLAEKQEQLIQTEKQASLGQLVAGVAHEINNPIQFIQGNIGILSEAFRDILPLLDEHGATDPKLRIARLEYPFFRQQLPVLLKDMADGATRIGAMVRDLKAFARRDEGRLDDMVDLNEAIQASVRLLHSQLKHFQVEEDLDPNLPKLRGSLTQLQQVVVNTLQNAAQALGHDAHGKIRISTRAEPVDRVRLSIEDNGSGMPPDVNERIFDPYFTTKQRSGGTGLGLAITYGIIQQHQGQIQVDTQVGAGTAFHFLLPVNAPALAVTRAS